MKRRLYPILICLFQIFTFESCYMRISVEHFRLNKETKEHVYVYNEGRNIPLKLSDKDEINLYKINSKDFLEDFCQDSNRYTWIYFWTPWCPYQENITAYIQTAGEFSSIFNFYLIVDTYDMDLIRTELGKYNIKTVLYILDDDVYGRVRNRSRRVFIGEITHLPVKDPLDWHSNFIFKGNKFIKSIDTSSIHQAISGFSN